MTTISGDSLAFFLPLHNEEALLPDVAHRTLEALGTTGLDHRLILVNDGSTDATAHISRQLVAANPDRISTMTHVRNIGYGGALRTGFAAGLATGANFIGFMDGDGQFDPHDVCLLLAKLENPRIDAAVGVRNGRRDKLHRLALGATWKAVSRKVLDCDLADVDCGFKVFRREVLEEVSADLMSKTGGAISPELVRRSQDAGAVFCEVPVTHWPRTQGKSSGAKPSVAIKSAIDLVRVRRDISSTQKTSGVSLRII